MIFKESDVFCKPEDLGYREWGTESLIYCSSGHYSFKLINIKKGMKGGLQYHHLKDECTYIVSGTLLIRYDLNDGSGLREKSLSDGMWVRFPTGMVHQEIAITDVVRIEVSTPYFNDRVRVEELYDEGPVIGLQSTKIEDVIKR